MRGVEGGETVVGMYGIRKIIDTKIKKKWTFLHSFYDAKTIQRDNEEIKL